MPMAITMLLLLIYMFWKEKTREIRVIVCKIGDQGLR